MIFNIHVMLPQVASYTCIYNGIHVHTYIHVQCMYFEYNLWHGSFQIGKLREDGHKDRFAKAPGARHDFKFSRTFEERAAQGEVFDTVVKKIVDQFVEGYNGTVFAYGQTSTGKTYTVEGSARQYEERGLVPR